MFNLYYVMWCGFIYSAQSRTSFVCVVCVYSVPQCWDVCVWKFLCFCTCLLYFLICLGGIGPLRCSFSAALGPHIRQYPFITAQLKSPGGWCVHCVNVSVDFPNLCETVVGNCNWRRVYVYFFVCTYFCVCYFLCAVHYSTLMAPVCL